MHQFYYPFYIEAIFGCCIILIIRIRVNGKKKYGIIASPLILPHGVTGIFITQSANIGKNVVVFQQVTIGANTIKSSKSYGAPTIEDNVYIGAGAKIIGNAYIGHNSRIGANAVVVKTIKPNTIVVPTNKIIESSNALDNTFVPYL